MPTALTPSERSKNHARLCREWGLAVLAARVIYPERSLALWWFLRRVTRGETV